MGNREGFHLENVAGAEGGRGHTTLDCFFGRGWGVGLLDVSMFNICVHVGATSELCNRV